MQASLAPSLTIVRVTHATFQCLPVSFPARSAAILVTSLPRCLEQGPTHSRCSIHIEWMNEGTRMLSFFSSACITSSYWVCGECSYAQFPDEETEPWRRADLRSQEPGTPAVVWVLIQSLTHCWQVKSPGISLSGLALVPRPQADLRVQGHCQNGNRYPGNLRPVDGGGGGGLGVQPRGHEDDACHMRAPRCKDTQLISCQERSKL